MKRFQDVNEYLAAATPAARNKMVELRHFLRSLLPKAEEKIWYGVPFYHLQGEVVGFAAYASHVSVGLGTTAFPTAYRKELQKKGYRTGQGTFQIRFDQDIPTGILRKLLQAKIKKRTSTTASKK